MPRRIQQLGAPRSVELRVELRLDELWAVHECVLDLVQCVELWDGAARRAAAEREAARLRAEGAWLRAENAQLLQAQRAQAQRAAELRRQFAADLALIGAELEEKRELEAMLASAPETASPLPSPSPSSRAVQRLGAASPPQPQSPQPPQPLQLPPQQLSPQQQQQQRNPAAPCRLLTLEAPLLLSLLAFATAADVRGAACTCNALRRRLGATFGGVPAMAPPALARAAAGAAAGGGGRRGSGGGELGPSQTTPLAGGALAAARKEPLSGGAARELVRELERLRRRVAVLVTEKEDLAAKLLSEAGVKSFLNEQLQATEASLAKSMEAVAQAAAQAASDHEVIGFLDTRNRELEQLFEDQ